MSEWPYLQKDITEDLSQLHFFAEADKAVNQKTASFVPCGWGSSIFTALGDCLRLIRQFPYEEVKEAGS